ncbi:hypothetical protein BKA93DRAFT_868915 [Sparassis latifolia]
MPTGTPNHSFIAPYNIRVDDFASSPDIMTTPALYLLTHTHADHVNGLSARSFSSTIICSRDAKEMLLRHEVYAERTLKDMELRVENVRTFSHLKVNPRKMDDGSWDYTFSRDLLKALPLHTPTLVPLNGKEEVTITLFDANHCPGAVMYLVEGAKGAVLHTGDFRAEPWFLESLSKNPYIQQYIAASPSSLPLRPYENGKLNEYGHLGVVKTLEAIYLDTACLLGTLNIPTKDEATSGLVSLMSIFPPTTLFFINAWTWGYEDIFKAVARTFRSKIHVDRYKFSIYRHTTGDPFLRSILTQDGASTRFHACERFSRCECVAVDGQGLHAPTAAAASSCTTSNKTGQHVVYVNPVTLGAASWELYLQDTRAKLLRGEVVNHLLVPLSRHSPLPELRAFVSMFRPKKVVPNTLDPALHGLDHACMRKMFAGCLASDSPVDSAVDVDARDLASALVTAEESMEDVALKNLEGEGALEVAERWAETGRSRHKLEVMREYLEGDTRRVVDHILDEGKTDSSPRQEQNTTTSHAPTGTTNAKKAPVPSFQGRASLSETARAMARIKSKFAQPESDEETEDEDAADERARTAHFLFAELAGIPPDQPLGACDKTQSPIVDDMPKRRPQTEKTKAAQSQIAKMPTQMPMTPPSKNSSLKIMPPSPESHTKRKVSQVSLRRPTFELGSPIHLDSQRSSDNLKRKTIQIIAPDAQFNDLTASTLFHVESGTAAGQATFFRSSTSTSMKHAASFELFAGVQESPNVPLVDLRNLSKGSAESLNSAQDDRSTDWVKRRRVSEASENVPVPAKNESNPTAHAKSPALHQSGDLERSPVSVPNPSHNVPEGCHDCSSASCCRVPAASSPPASTSSQVPMSAEQRAKKERRAARALRKKRARILALMRPDLVSPAHAAKMAAKMERRRLRLLLKHQHKQTPACKESQTVVPATPDSEMSAGITQTPRFTTPSRLPSQDDEFHPDGQMDVERSRKLAESFKQAMAKGIRPGLVIPMLPCLKSQEGEAVAGSI